MRAGRPTRVFYGWWIVFAAFLNLFFSVGIIYYGFPVFYPSLVSSLGFTRAQLILGFLLGFLVAAAVLGFLAGVMIDRWGVRPVIQMGIWFVGVPLVLMGFMSRLWHYYDSQSGVDLELVPSQARQGHGLCLPRAGVGRRRLAAPD